MKTKHLLLSIGAVMALVPLLFFSSCEKAKELSTFTVNLHAPDQVVILDSAQFKTSETILAQFPLSINLDSILSSHGFSSGQITGCWFQNLTVTIQDPTWATFDFINSARASVANQVSFVQDEAEIAVATAIDHTSRTFSLALHNLDIIPQLNQNQFYVRLYGEQIAPIPVQYLTLLFSSEVKLRVEPL